MCAIIRFIPSKSRSHIKRVARWRQLTVFSCMADNLVLVAFRSLLWLPKVAPPENSLRDVSNNSSQLATQPRARHKEQRISNRVWWSQSQKRKEMSHAHHTFTCARGPFKVNGFSASKPRKYFFLPAAPDVSSASRSPILRSLRISGQSRRRAGRSPSRRFGQ